MRHATFIIHLAALATLFVTLGQPFAEDKPAGVRRAVETIAKKKKAPSISAYEIENGEFIRLAD